MNQNDQLEMQMANLTPVPKPTPGGCSDVFHPASCQGNTETCFPWTKKARMLVVLSGGQDSTTSLFWVLQGNVEEVFCVTFDYNQRHRNEIQAAKDVVEIARKVYPHIPIHHEIIELGPVLKGTSPLVSDAKLEQYKDHGSLPGGLEKTFVPMRNQMFLTIAANRAYIHNCGALVTGVCEEDYGGYPDCRQRFINSLMHTCNIGTFTGQDGANGALAILTPLMKLSKKQTVEMAMEFPGCYAALSRSHTSYDGQYPPIGHDHATLLRAKGFEQANIPDPLVLRAVRDNLMSLPTTPNYRRADFIGFVELAGL